MAALQVTALTFSGVKGQPGCEKTWIKVDYMARDEGSGLPVSVDEAVRRYFRPKKTLRLKVNSNKKGYLA